MILHLIPQLNKLRIVLASGSPRRIHALKSLGFTNVEVIPSKFAENFNKADFPHASGYVEATALQKTKDVWESLHDKPDLTIGADTIVVLGERIIEKPSSPEDAVNILSMLSGNTHKVLTSVCLILKSGEIESFLSSSDVTFAKIPIECIKAYVDSGEPMDKAGGYGTQTATGSSFISAIHGCFWNVTGFPVHNFCVKILGIQDKLLK